MPKLLFYLSGENVGIGKAEVLALTNAERFELVDRFLVVDTEKKDLDERLAFTHKIFRVLFSCKSDGLTDKVESFNWNHVYEKDFCVRVVGSSSFSEKDLAAMIFHKLKNPSVNLKNSYTTITFIFTQNKVFATILLSEIEKSFNGRRAHLRPEFHPTSLHPRLARALVNLTGATKGSKVLDPFCGCGGFLIEAGLMGLRSVGYDLDRIMINRSKINLDFFKIKNYKLVQKDSTKLSGKFDFVVTDLPYGKNSKVSGSVNILYLSFLRSLKTVLVKRAVVVFPYFADYKSLIKQSGLKLVESFDFYIHKSLSKRIVVLRN